MTNLTELAGLFQLRGNPLKQRNNFNVEGSSILPSTTYKPHYSGVTQGVYADCNCDGPGGTECDCTSDDCSDDD